MQGLHGQVTKFLRNSPGAPFNGGRESGGPGYTEHPRTRRRKEGEKDRLDDAAPTTAERSIEHLSCDAVLMEETAKTEPAP
jgi:hypothetical protein